MGGYVSMELSFSRVPQANGGRAGNALRFRSGTIGRCRRPRALLLSCMPPCSALQRENAAMIGMLINEKPLTKYNRFLTTHGVSSSPSLTTSCGLRTNTVGASITETGTRSFSSSYFLFGPSFRVFISRLRNVFPGPIDPSAGRDHLQHPPYSS